MRSRPTFHRMTPQVSKHRYTVPTEPGSALRARLERAFHRTDVITVETGELPGVPRGTFLVVGMHEGAFQLQRWRDD